MKSIILTIVVLAALSTSCKSSKDTTEEWASERSTNTENRKQRMSPEELFAQFDLDKSGTLVKTEVKGRLAEQFDKIDTNSDGSLSIEEVKNAPKPKGRKPQMSAPR